MNQPLRSLPSPWVAALFAVSGFSSLAFEVLWQRELALVFGSTVQSTAATVAAFMAGLGLGAWLAPALVRRYPLPGRLFAVLELLVAVSGLGVTLAVPHLTLLTVPLYHAAPGLFTFLRLALVFLLLAVPCVCMGASLPVLSQFLVRDEASRFQTRLGLLYGLNTLGAAVGAFGTDFWLVPALGLRTSGLCAAALDLTVSAVAGAWFRLEQAVPQDAAEEVGAASPAGLALLLSALGLCGLLLEITWTRLLVFFNGSEVYSFSLTLATYLGGVVIGSLLFASLRRPITLRTLALGTVLLGGLAIGGLATVVALRKGGIGSDSLAAMVGRDVAVMLPATICLGFLFPLASSLLSRGFPARTVARAYLWNTGGAVVGAVGAGFWFLPWLGLQGTLLLAGGVALMAGLWTLASVSASRWRLALACVGILAVGGILSIPPTVLLAALWGPDFKTALFHGENEYGCVAMMRQWDGALHGDIENLMVDGFNMAGNSLPAMHYTTTLALAPMVLHPKPERVLVICLGLANTLHAALACDATREVDCVELSDKVVAADMLLPTRREWLQSPKLHLILGDGRHHLLTTTRQYDIITAEPPPPTHAGVVNLYTREYDELCRSRLAPRGLVAQWLPIWEMSRDDAREIIRAFQDVFPYTTVWEGQYLQLCLVGSMEPQNVDYRTIVERLQANRSWLEPMSMADPELLAGSFMADADDLRSYVSDVTPLTDDWPRLSYHQGEVAPDLAWFYGTPHHAAVITHSGAEAAEVAQGQATMNDFHRYLLPGSLFDRHAAGRRALSHYPNNRYFMSMLLCDASVEAGYQAQASQTDNAGAWYQLARIAYLRGDTATARTRIEAAVAAKDGSAFRPYRDWLMKQP